MIKLELNKNWIMRAVGEKEFIPATVPGSVYNDLLNNKKMEDPFWKDNEDKSLKLMEKDYEYLSTFDVPRDIISCQKILLHFYGIDTLARIYLNGINLGYANNMHREWEYDVTDIVKEQNNELKIVFESSLNYVNEEYKKNPIRGTGDPIKGFMHIRKAHYMFGWDWGAHLPDEGIFRPVVLLGINEARIDSVYISQNHKDNLVNLNVEPKFDIFDGAYNAKYKVTIISPNGEVKEYNNSPKSIDIVEPKLWWPNNLGEQNLYTFKLELIKENEIIDTWEKRIGLRTFTISRNKDEYGEEFCFVVNGKKIFAMGADYIPEDHLVSRTSKELTYDLLKKTVFANHNSVRVWGGGYYPPDWFYDICDELGLLVWQDFMFGCANYELTDEFEENIKEEFKDNIKRIRHHACVGLWCGNNENEEFVVRGIWKTKDGQEEQYLKLAEEIIPASVKEFDPNRYYWPSSPSSGGKLDNPTDPNRGDCHYWEVWHGSKPLIEYRNYYFRFLSEFGFQSFPSIKTIESFTDDENDKNVFSYIMEKHQRNASANGKILNYLGQTYKYPTKFDVLVYASQLLQADAIRYGVEHYRRNRGRCMGTMYWQLNDCWPVASWSSIDYFHRLKALHYSSKRFFSPIMISVEEESLVTADKILTRLPLEYNKNVKFNVANETLNDISGIVKWEVRNNKGDILESHETNIEVSKLSTSWLEKVDLPNLDIRNEYVSYSFEMDGEVVSFGTLIFTYPKHFNFLKPEISYRVEGDEIILSSNVYTKYVYIQNENDDLVLSDNFFDLNANEKRVKILEGKPNNIKIYNVFDIK